MDKLSFYWGVMFTSHPGSLADTEPDGEYEKLRFENKKGLKPWQITEILELLEKYIEKGWIMKDSNLARENGNGYISFFS